MNNCSNCGSNRLILDTYTGELKCEECGYVVEEGMIDCGPEWRAYDEEQKLARTRAEPSRNLTPLSTVIGKSSSLGVVKKHEFARLSLIQESISSEEDRSLNAGRKEINRLTAALQLPGQVRDEAFRLFGLACRAHLLRVGGITSMAAACILLACREFQIPSPTKKLCELASADSSKVRRCYMELLEHLGSKLKLKPPSPIKYIPMIANRLGLSQRVQLAAAEIIRVADEARVILGKPPRSVAAAALYISSIIYGEKRGRMSFASVAGITETTLRKRARELLRKLDIVVKV